MPVGISVQWDKAGLASIEPGQFKRAMLRAVRKAGATALRDMRSESSKRIRARKRISPKYIGRAITLRRAIGSDVAAMQWSIQFSGDPVPLVAYPHRQTDKGVSVEVNVGKRTVVAGSFEATMRSGHEGIFRRAGRTRLPINELLGSRPVDAMLHEGEAQAVADRGGKSLADTYARLLPLELAKK
jgi:hypothetical protein